MKKNILIVLILLVVVSAVSASIYFLKQNKSVVSPVEENAQEDSASTPTEQENVAEENNPEDNVPMLVTDDFSINLPAGWVRTEPMAGVSAMAVNSNEQISDPEAQKINFKSYLAVVYDMLKGASLAEYAQAVKNALEQSVPGAVFTKDQDLTINGRPSHATEAEMTQQGIDFKVLLIVIKGEGDDVWGMSFNTVRSSWDAYEEAFYTTANSFVVKI